jgi:uncharacterized membrane protein
MTKKISRKRHLYKAITWRIVASISTFIISWTLTGNFKAGLTIGGVDFFIKFILYYFHERIWYRSKYGID